MDAKDAKEQALKEVEEEKFKEAKNKYKAKLKELAGAEKVVNNIKLEIEDLDDTLSQ